MSESLKDIIVSDLKRYIIDSEQKKMCTRAYLCKTFFYEYFRHESFYYTFWLRIGFVLVQKKGNVFTRILRLIVGVIHLRNSHRLGIQIPLGTRIGKGLRFGHYSNIVIAAGAVIGNNCTLHNGVTIGRTFSKEGGTPVIGNNVIIFPNSCVVGRIHVGNGCIIASNTVVTKDSGDNFLLYGSPARCKAIEREDCIDNNWKGYFE